jgi:hypothetical protein
MNLARHGAIRQTQLNSLWCWALIAQGSFILIGYPWYMGNILFSFAVTGQALRWFSLQTRNDILLAIAIVVAWLLICRQLRSGRGLHADQQLAALSGERACRTDRVCRAVGCHGTTDECP